MPQRAPRLSPLFDDADQWSWDGPGHLDWLDAAGDRGGRAAGGGAKPDSGGGGKGGGATKNAAPVARDDSATTDENTPVKVGVLANDSDRDGDPLSVVMLDGRAVSAGQSLLLASGAKVTLNPDHSVAYDPNGVFAALTAGQTGTDSFTYRISDGRGGEAQATARLSITGIGGTTDDGGTSGGVPYYVEDLLVSSSSRWNYPQPYGTAVSVTYTFLDSVPGYYSSTDWAHDKFRAFSAQQQDLTRGALADIERYANIDFVEVQDVGQAAITFGIADIPSYVGYAYYPSGTGINRKAGDVWIDSAYVGSTFTLGSAQYKTLIHEIGHAIGLDHPSTLSGAENSRMYTVMSYNKHPTMSGEPVTHMLYDVATVQYLYGVNNAGRAGDDTYRLADLNNRILTIWDAGGKDMIDLGDASRAITLDLRPGSYSTVTNSGSNNLAIAYGVTIENARTGSGADVLTGNAADNLLNGGAGNDRLTGGAGRDLFQFDPGWGWDTVTDFSRGEDRLDLIKTGYAMADLAISFDSSGAMISDGSNRISLLGVGSLSDSDFLFALSA